MKVCWGCRRSGRVWRSGLLLMVSAFLFSAGIIEHPTNCTDSYFSGKSEPLKNDIMKEGLPVLRGLCLRSFPEFLADLKLAAMGSGPASARPGGAGSALVGSETSTRVMEFVGEVGLFSSIISLSHADGYGVRLSSTSRRFRLCRVRCLRRFWRLEMGTGRWARVFRWDRVRSWERVTRRLSSNTLSVRRLHVDPRTMLTPHVQMISCPRVYRRSQPSRAHLVAFPLAQSSSSTTSPSSACTSLLPPRRRCTPSPP